MPTQRSLADADPDPKRLHEQGDFSPSEGEFPTASEVGFAAAGYPVQKERAELADASACTRDPGFKTRTLAHRIGSDFLHEQADFSPPDAEFSTASEGATTGEAATASANASACTQDRFGLSARAGRESTH